MKRLAGFALVEVMFALALLGVVSLGTASYMNHQAQTIKANRGYSSRDILETRLYRSIIDGASLTQSASMSGNSGFSTCILGGVGVCSIAPQDQGMVLTDSLKTPIAGTANAPVYYDIDLQPCTPGPSAPRCALQATSSFTPDCGGTWAAPNPTCAVAVAVTLKVVVKQVSGPAPASLGSFRTITAEAHLQVPIYVAKSGNKDYLALWQAGGVIGASSVFQTGQYLGSGTTNPLGIFHVATPPGQDANDALVESDSTSAGAPRLELVDTALASSTSAPAWLLANQADQFYFAYQPNIGAALPAVPSLFVNLQGGQGMTAVGTNNPASLLHVAVDSPSPDPTSDNDINIKTWAPFYDPSLQFGMTRGTASAPLPMRAGDKLAQIQFDGASSNAAFGGVYTQGAGIDWQTEPGFAATSNSSMSVYGMNFTTPTPVHEGIHLSANGKIRIHGDGVTAATEALEVNGNVYVNATYLGAAGHYDCTLGSGAGGVSCASDARLKDHIAPIRDALSRILSLRGVSFDWNALSGSPGHHSIGVIAQEVRKAFPTAVHMAKDTGYLTVGYASLVAPLVEALRELRDYSLSASSGAAARATRIDALSRARSEQDRAVAGLGAAGARIAEEERELRERLERLER